MRPEQTAPLPQNKFKAKKIKKTKEDKKKRGGDEDGATQKK